MEKLQNKFMIIIYGPTGVGKTDLALRLAEKIPSEIINMDVGQFYTPFSIGTAKPDWKNEPITHHLFDVINAPSSLTVAQYRDMVLQKLHEIWKRNRIPILVGGSGFYLKSLFFPPQAQATNNDHIDIDALYPNDADLWQELYKIDAERAQEIERHDEYRIKRALEIWHSTGRLPSEFAPIYNPPADYLLLHVTREREELYRRINKRVMIMLEEGWLDEVARLQGAEWEEFIHDKRLIGYNELLDYLEKEKNEGERNEKLFSKTVGVIKKRTRHYAKRQETFWRMLERELDQVIDQHCGRASLETINLTFADVDLYIKQLRERLKNCIPFK